MKTQKIVIVDDNEAIYLGISKEIISHNPHTHFIHFQSPEQVVKAIDSLPLRCVILMDVYFINEPSQTSEKTYDLIQNKRKDIKIITMSSQLKPFIIQKFIEMGSRGFYLKSDPIKELIDGLSEIKDDGIFYSTSAKKSMMSITIGGDQMNSISKRELEILNLISQGMSNSEISDKLSISIFTVQNHRQNILNKLQVKNTAELIRKSVSEGLIE